MLRTVLNSFAQKCLEAQNGICCGWWLCASLAKQFYGFASMQISVCGFQAGEQLLSLIVATLTASVAIGAGQIVANVVNTRSN